MIQQKSTVRQRQTADDQPTSKTGDTRLEGDVQWRVTVAPTSSDDGSTRLRAIGIGAPCVAPCIAEQRASSLVQCNAALCHPQCTNKSRRYQKGGVRQRTTQKTDPRPHGPDPPRSQRPSRPANKQSATRSHSLVHTEQQRVAEDSMELIWDGSIFPKTLPCKMAADVHDENENAAQCTAHTTAHTHTLQCKNRRRAAPVATTLDLKTLTHFGTATTTRWQTPANECKRAQYKANTVSYYKRVHSSVCEPTRA